MAKIIKRKKALSVNPLKASSTIGAALAFLGFHRSIPMLHGSQGCTAFGKVFFVRHFREPVPLQTTAMDQVSSVMGADDNVVEGLKTLCEKSKPSLIGVPTTGLAETQGCDVKLAMRVFREKYPEYADIPVIPVATPDFTGCLESGFAQAVEALIDVMVPDAESAKTKPGARKHQVNVLVGAALTPGDLEQLKEMLESFGLRPVVVPDLSDSLDGRLTEDEFSPLTIGGTAVSELATLGDSIATLVVGASMKKAADLLHKRTGVESYRFDHLMGMDAVDEFVATLAKISSEPVPAKLERQRAQLQDAMLDTHFMLGQTRVAIAGDADLLNGFSHLMAGMGAETVAAVAPANTPALSCVAAETVKVGDLEELENLCKQGDAEIIISNSHAAALAERLGVPLVRAGFPQYDLLGGYQRVWIGYQGARQTLFEVANILLNLERGEIHPYDSIFAPASKSQPESRHVLGETADDTGYRH
jgi:nitrogenase molybdenum-iron protein NifN